ncbi:MAG TPA: hypothetical protein VMA35_03940 [Candidatus Sulfopaludibacter sp.]|nr:hypothetical protein [Candidatus Sulfopaludibacter sp.]
MKLLPFILLFVFAVHLWAMDRFAALSMIESGNNDQARGRGGELSRYQFSPTVIAEFKIDATQLQNPAYARSEAIRVMNYRCSAFDLQYHRPPTDVEFYMLWHRPDRVFHPLPRELERARRFANLVSRQDTK